MRGVDPEDCRIMYAPEERRLWFSIKSPSGLHPSYHTRSLDGGWRVYAGTPKSQYWFGHYHSGRFTVLVEGIFDALALYRGAIALLGTKISDAHISGLKAAGITDVMVWFDPPTKEKPDDPGWEAEKEVVRKLQASGISARAAHHEHEPSECPAKCKYFESILKLL